MIEEAGVLTPYSDEIAVLIARYKGFWSRGNAALARLAESGAQLEATQRRIARSHALAYRRDSRDYVVMF